MIKKTTGFTLTELLVGLVVGGILILMIGVLSNISLGSYEKMRKEAEVYNDLYYCINLMKHSIRAAKTVNADVNNNILTTDNFVFKKNNTDFICTDTTIHSDNILVRGVTDLNFTLGNPSNKLITINLRGKKDKVDFNFSTQIKQRI